MKYRFSHHHHSWTATVEFVGGQMRRVAMPTPPPKDSEMWWDWEEFLGELAAAEFAAVVLDDFTMFD